MQPYYLSILGIGVANLVLAAVAYAQRAKQIRGNRLRERQIALAESRNRLAERRLRRLDDELAILSEIRDGVCADRPQPKVGVIDVGSATVRLVVARYDPRLRSLVQMCKSGEYMHLGPEVERHGMYKRATLLRLGDRLRALVAEAERVGCERLAVVVTAPGRSGANAGKLLRVVHRATGHEPHLLSPREEARLAFAGATLGPAAAAPATAVVFDVGGGSTEVAVGSPGAGVTTSESFAIGAFVLAERHFRHDPPTSSELAAARKEAVRTLDLQLGPVGEIALATGGSARAVGRLAGPLVGKEELEAALEHAISSRKPIKNQRRRRSLPAGILILDALHSAIDMPLTIAANGLREGVLLHLADVSSPLGPGTPAFDLAAMRPSAA